MRTLTLMAASLLLAACTEDPPDPDRIATTIPENLRESAPATPAIAD